MQEVQSATFTMVKERRPDALMTRAERFFEMNRIGSLLYTPPYSPDFQFIELFWAHAKRYVASSWNGKTRTMAETAELLRYGFYGKRQAGGTWEVRPPDCAKLVNKSMEYADEAVTRDDILQGSIANLENVPDKYKVSKESGLADWEDDGMELLDLDVEVDVDMEVA